jgi:hypothetical protein
MKDGTQKEITFVKKEVADTTKLTNSKDFPAAFDTKTKIKSIDSVGGSNKSGHGEVKMTIEKDNTEYQITITRKYPINSEYYVEIDGKPDNVYALHTHSLEGKLVDDLINNGQKNKPQKPNAPKKPTDYSPENKMEYSKASRDLKLPKAVREGYKNTLEKFSEYESDLKQYNLDIQDYPKKLSEFNSFAKGRMENAQQILNKGILPPEQKVMIEYKIIEAEKPTPKPAVSETPLKNNAENPEQKPVVATTTATTTGTKLTRAEKQQAVIDALPKTQGAIDSSKEVLFTQKDFRLEFMEATLKDGTVISYLNTDNKQVSIQLPGGKSVSFSGKDPLYDKAYAFIKPFEDELQAKYDASGMGVKYTVNFSKRF